MRPILRIGTRGSALALTQAEWTSARLRALGHEVEVTIIRTAGDERASDAPWGEGAFVVALHSALLERHIDIAVHSAKDLPTAVDERLTVAAWSSREDPRDALACRERGLTLATLPAGARVGTDSPRRAAMLRSVRPDLLIHPMRGNVDTRLAKLARGETDALVLAMAGLARLGRTDCVDEALDPAISVPAPGQGALALQCRADDPAVIGALRPLDDPASRAEIEAERAFLAAMGGGCRSPIGGLGTAEDGTLTLRVAFERSLVLPGGAVRSAGLARMTARGPVQDRLAVATGLAARALRLRERASVLVTRQANEAAPLVDALSARGMDACVIGTIAVEAADGPIDAAIAAAPSPLRIVATSANGVRAALAAVNRAGLDPAEARWAVVGRSSAHDLAALGITPWLPPRPDGATLAATLPLAPGERLLLVRGDRSEESTEAGLTRRGATVQSVVGYLTVEGPAASREPLRAALTGPIDAVVVASGSAARGLLALAPGDQHERLLATPLVCIGATTARVAAGLGFRSISVAADPYPDQLADAVVAALEAALPVAGEAHATSAQGAAAR